MTKLTIATAKRQQGLMTAGIIALVLIIALIVFLAMYTYKLDAEIVSKFEIRRWDVPATVYSRPLVLSADSVVSASDLEYWLGKLNYDPKDTGNTGSYSKKGNSYTIHTRGFDYGDGDIDPKQTIKISFSGNKLADLQSTVPNSDGMIRLEPINIGGIYPESNEDRIILNKDEIPEQLTDALIATEDRNFYEHYGVSLRGTARALLSNVRGGSTQGGSTITQQLIKNFYLSSERSLKRKVNEALMALLLERHYSKQDILLTYLNEINLGQNGNRSVNGFGLASQFYFNKPLSELRLDQYALLVGIAKGPSYYNPRKYPKRAQDRRDTVLHNMLVMGKIDQQSYDDALKYPIDDTYITKTPTIAKSQFPDFFDAVQRELKRYYKDQDLRTAGLRIISTLDPIAQHSADQAMKTQLVRLRKSNKATANLQGALVSADPKTGELVAMVGSGDEFTGFNRAIDAKRQVGSLLKPVIYLTAIQSGKYNLASTVKDEPVSYPSGGKPWTPKNYSGRSYGDVPLMTALANSYNQSAVNVGMEFGITTFKKQLHQLGIRDDVPDYPSVLLGAVDLSPMDMLGMYQVFASGGYHTPIHSIKQVINEKGEVLQHIDDYIQTTQRIPPEAMFVTNYALSQVIKEGTAKDALSLGSQLNLAGKTGTTNDARDAWFAGFSGNYVSVVWVGRDDNKPIGLTGGKGALPIWTDYMRRLSLAPVRLGENDVPSDKVTWAWLENGTGKLSEAGCGGAIYVPLLTEFTPKESSECLYDTARERYNQQQANELGDELVDTGNGYVEEENTWQEPPTNDNTPSEDEGVVSFGNNEREEVEP